MQLSLIIVIMLLLQGCANKVTSIKQDQDKELTNDKGYLLLGIQTNLDLKSIRIDGPENIELSSKDIKEGSSYFLLDLAAGQYTLDQVKLNSYWRRELTDEDYWQFDVMPGTINYVGHLELETWGKWYPTTHAELVNRSSEALEFLEEKFPNILTNRSISYGGPGQDSFFEFLANQHKVK
ncbi:MAG: hypothetical protein QMC62_13410 [Alteromonadaceae bacterium]|jgi:hypothetical protein